jgi:hypothetical protein
LRTRVLPKGYLYVTLYQHNRRGDFGVHTLVMHAFCGPRPEGCEINHINGVKSNNAFGNLEYVTPARNVAHSVETGLYFHRGERATNVKLTSEQVLEMRRLYATGRYTHKQLALIFPVHPHSIGGILRGESWKHLA